MHDMDFSPFEEPSVFPLNYASYDAEGNIILQPLHRDRDAKEKISDAPPPEPHRIRERQYKYYAHQCWKHCKTICRRRAAALSQAQQRALRECRVFVSWLSFELRAIPTRFQKIRDKMLPRFYAFLLQPVWIPGRHGEPKEYSRVTLFVFDVVRFGGTFAVIFGMLFVALNYESFWKITKARLTPRIHTEGAFSLEETLQEKLKKSPSLAVAGEDAGLLAFLPPVGPPENRLIIPKLNINVPIVTPPNDALLQENWKQFEEDIQHALQNGVVHYPGTARPGQTGNFFVTGHSSYYPWASGNYKTVFARLPELSVGDEYWVYYNGDKYRYVITEKYEVRPDDVTVLDQPQNKRLSTLMTCVPVGTTLRRLIVRAQEVDPMTGKPLEPGERGHQEQLPQIRVETLPI